MEKREERAEGIKVMSREGGKEGRKKMEKERLEGRR
jgi:hypothetical protein